MAKNLSSELICGAEYLDLLDERYINAANAGDDDLRKNYIAKLQASYTLLTALGYRYRKVDGRHTISEISRPREITRAFYN